MSLILKHNGTAVDLAAEKIEPVSLARSFAGPATLTLRCATAFDDPDHWLGDDAITLEADGATVFDGWVKRIERQAGPDGEWVLYTCLGPRAVADTLPLRVGGSARVVYNCPLEERPDEEAFVALGGSRATLGQIAAHILDSMAPDLAPAIGDGSPGSGYVQADLDALAVVPPKLVFCGESVDEALRRLLRYAPDFALFVDPATHKARFLDLRSATARDIPGLGADVLRHRLSFSTQGCFTAAVVEADAERVDVAETLTPAWNTALEADWTSEKAAQQPDTYGAVWRLFAAAEPAQQGGAIADERCIGSGDILATISWTDGAKPRAMRARAAVADDTTLLLDTLARRWDPAAGRYVPATVTARYTYTTGRIVARYPATGYVGTAYERHGITRELRLFSEEHGKRLVKGVVRSVPAPDTFTVEGPLALPGELAGSTVEFNADGVHHAVVGNEVSSITLAAAPSRPIAPGDPFTITVQDDTAKAYDGGTLSALEKFAREQLEALMDERVEGTVPLAGLDWSLAPGIRVNFTQTDDPDLADLRALVVAIEHDLARQRTVLTLTRARAAGLPSWDDLERERRQERDAAKARRRRRRIWRRFRRRRKARLGPVGDPHELAPDGPLAGDGVWIDVDYNTVSHIGPGPEDRTIGGAGQYIEWIRLDARGHVIDAAAGTFS